MIFRDVHRTDSCGVELTVDVLETELNKRSAFHSPYLKIEEFFRRIFGCKIPSMIDSPCCYRTVQYNTSESTKDGISIRNLTSSTHIPNKCIVYSVISLQVS